MKTKPSTESFFMTALYICIAILVGSVIFLNQTGRLEDDSPAEEFVEEVVESVFGMPVDLSPGSEEDGT